MIQQFSLSTSKSIGFYVYVLVDPLDNVPFYVGKGKGDRVFSHVKSVERKIAKRQPVTMTGKDLKILEILTRKGGPNEVLHYIVRYGLTNDQALAIESVLIDLFNRKLKLNIPNAENITNVNDGFYSHQGCILAEELDKAINCKVALLDPNKRYIAINLNVNYDGNDKEYQIYERVRSSWILNKELADQADYILATHAGVVVGVYKLDEKGWQLVPGQDLSLKKKRYYFDKNQVDDISEERERLLGCKLPSRKKGAQNPVWYVSGWENK